MNRPNPIAERFAVKLRSLCKKHNHGVSKAADVLGFPRSTFKGWWYGKFLPGYEDVVRISRIYGVGVDHFRPDESDGDGTKITSSQKKLVEWMEQVKRDFILASDEEKESLVSLLTVIHRKNKAEVIRWLKEK